MPKAKAPKVNTIQAVREGVNPQLCKVFSPIKHKWEHSWLAEPKFDGLRCITIVEAHKAKAYSRNGKPLWNMDNILAEIESHAAEANNLVLDGEVYTKDWNLSMGIVKRSTQKHPDQDKLRYHVWDCLTLKEWKSKWINSAKQEHAVFSNVSNGIRRERLFPLLDCKNIEVVQGVLVSNQEELQDAYQRFLIQGYEGAILKNLNGIYEGGRRSPNWLKIKPWSDADLIVVGSYPGEGKHLGRIGGLVLEGMVEWNERTIQVKTEVGTGFTDEERDFFQGLSVSGTLVGKIVEIKYQDITVEGACRFPVYHRLREDKE